MTLNDVGCPHGHPMQRICCMSAVARLSDCLSIAIVFPWVAHVFLMMTNPVACYTTVNGFIANVLHLTPTRFGAGRTASISGKCTTRNLNTNATNVTKIGLWLGHRQILCQRVQQCGARTEWSSTSATRAHTIRISYPRAMFFTHAGLIPPWSSTLENSLRPYRQEMSKVIALIRGISLDAHRGDHLTVVGSKLCFLADHTHSSSTFHHSWLAPPAMAYIGHDLLWPRPGRLWPRPGQLWHHPVTWSILGRFWSGQADFGQRTLPPAAPDRPPPDRPPPDRPLPSAGRPSAGPPFAGPPSAGPPSAGPPKISRFFFLLPPPIFILFFSLSGDLLVSFFSLRMSSRVFFLCGGSSRGILVVFWSVGTSNVLVFALGLSQTQPLGEGWERFFDYNNNNFELSMYFCTSHSWVGVGHIPRVEGWLFGLGLAPSFLGSVLARPRPKRKGWRRPSPAKKGRKEGDGEKRGRPSPTQE